MKTLARAVHGLMICSFFLAARIEAASAPNAMWGKFEGLYENSTRTPVLPMIEQARRSLDIEIYTMQDPSVLRALRQARARGVRVRIVQDPTPYSESACQIFSAPSPQDPLPCQELKAFYRDMVASGATYVPFDKTQLCGPNADAKSCFEHGKLLIVDGEVALLSTGNFDRDNFCHPARADSVCNRDYSIVTRDLKVVTTLTRIFELDLLGKRYDLSKVLPPELANRLTVSPLSLEPLLKFIAASRRSLVIQNQYITDSRLLEAINSAARRGVRVYLNVSSFCAFGPPSDRTKALVNEIFTKYEQTGVATSLFNSSIPIRGQPGYLHAKAIVVDETWAWVGSVNGSTSALEFNREFGLFFSRADWVRPLLAQIKSDFTNPGAETWRESLACLKDKPFSL